MIQLDRIDTTLLDEDEKRELYELLPYLRATEVKCGWLLKKGETSSAGFKPRYCVLFSSYRLLYFDSEACTKRKGAVDLSVAIATKLLRRNISATDNEALIQEALGQFKRVQ